MSAILSGFLSYYHRFFSNADTNKTRNKDMIRWLYKNSKSNNQNPSIYIVLTRSKSIAAKAVEIYKHDEFTHAAISLDSGLKTLYSFGRKWVRFPFIGCFCNEVLDKGFYATHETLPGVIIRLDITKAQYRRALKIISQFIKNKDAYKYNFLGFFGNVLGLEFKSEYRYTCSEFVAFVLQQSGIVEFDTPLNLIRPQQLANIKGHVIYKGDLKQYNLYANNSKIA